MSHVLWTTGARLPVERIAAIAHDRGALVAIDGAQSVGAIPVSVTETGADFYAVAGQKWLLGPEGTGGLWAAPDAVERAAASHVGWFSFESIDLRGRAVYHPDARRFEASNHHRPSVVGLARSCGWLSMYVGLPWIHARGAALARAAADRLATIPGVELITPRNRMATLVTFRIAGWPADAALAELGSRVFAIARTVAPLDAIRISVGFFNSEAEIERFAGAVELLAAHAPDTLPPKPRLTILGQDERMTGDPRVTGDPRPPARRRSWADIRWRQFRNAPRPVVRAVLSSLLVAIGLGTAYLAYDIAISRGASLPGGDLRVALAAIYVALVLVTGSVLTYLVVPQPTGSGTRSLRTPWSAALGFFAAVPICYLVLVVAVQVLKPLLV